MSSVFDPQAWGREILEAFGGMVSTVADFLPSLVGAVVILLVGWLLSRLIGSVSTRALDRLGLDGLLERLGAAGLLERLGMEGGAASLVGRLVFWVLMLAFLMAAADVLQLDAVTATLKRIFAYLPNVISAAVIVVIGTLLARFAGRLVTSGGTAANLVYARQLGSATQVAVTVMVFVVVLEQLGVDTDVLVTVISALVAMVALGLGLSFALGSRDVVQAILASHYLRQSLSEGDAVEVQGRRGRVERIGPTDTLFRDGDQAWSIPNAQLLNEIVVR